MEVSVKLFVLFIPLAVDRMAGEGSVSSREKEGWGWCASGSIDECV